MAFSLENTADDRWAEAKPRRPSVLRHEVWHLFLGLRDIWKDF